MNGTPTLTPALNKQTSFVQRYLCVAREEGAQQRTVGN